MESFEYVFEILELYISRLVTDARSTREFERANALRILNEGAAGRITDPLLSAASALAGLPESHLHSRLLDQARSEVKRPHRTSAAQLQKEY